MLSVFKLDEPELNPLLEELNPLLEELNPLLELNPESEKEEPELLPEKDDPEEAELLTGLALIST